MQVLAIEDVTRNLMGLLDFQSIEKLLEASHQDTSMQGLLFDMTLWQNMLQLHYHGSLPKDLRYLTLPQKNRQWDWNDDTKCCKNLQYFLRSGDELYRFNEKVQIIRGDIGRIQSIQNEPLDGIAFPTNSYLVNHFMGAAGSVFKRAGLGLSAHVQDPAFRQRRNVGSAVPTPGFDAGVRRLIHCVGPRITQANWAHLLADTYDNLMSAILGEGLNCVAIASISTGNMGLPAEPASLIALRRIQHFLRANYFEGSLAIVCFEDHVFDAFNQSKAAILKGFNEEIDLQVLESTHRFEY